MADLLIWGPRELTAADREEIGHAMEGSCSRKLDPPLTGLHKALQDGCQMNWILAVLFYISRAKRIARPTSIIFAVLKDVINDPILPFETVCRWSQLTAQFRSMPSAFERNTSDGMFRIVVVIGTMVTSPRYSNTESLVRIRIGLFLSGLANLYQRISPCFIHRPRLAPFPKPKIPRQ